jgi:GTPase KRas protein
MSPNLFYFIYLFLFPLFGAAQMTTGDGFVLGYSITSTTSFDAASKLRGNILRIKDGISDIPIMLVGNKCDLESERLVSTEEGRRAAENWKTGFIEASAKTPKNVTEIFVGLVRLIDKWRENHPNMRPDPNSTRPTTRRLCVLL